jgi:hypothetical protein
MTIYTPPVSVTLHELPLGQVPWKDFELLCLHLIKECEGFNTQQMQIYGIPGQGQEGIDIYARLDSGRFNSYQCKRYQKINAPDLTDVVGLFRKGKWFEESDKFVLCTSCSMEETALCDRFEELRLALEMDGVLLEKWDFGYLNQFLKNQPKIVYQFFGEAWCRAFCGERLYEQVIGAGLAKVEEISRDFKMASDALDRVSSYFGTGSIHIDRKETAALIAWCLKDLLEDQRALAVVQGGAGMGKTVVMKDVMKMLDASGVPVLAIKADAFQAANVPKLEVLLFQNHSSHIVESIRVLLLQHEKVVVLIDQIDALSQSLTTNRAFITSYVGLVKNLLGIPGVRTILSTRSFDLEYDGDLRAFKSRKYFHIKVEMLSVEEVKQVIAERGYYHPTDKLVFLLRTPNHLNIFCKLPRSRNSKPELITSQKELYDSFWKSLTHGITFKKKFRELVYEIARKINGQGVIIVPNIYLDDYEEALNFALSNQLLIEEPNGLQFFHQTFYEYVFARQFVESKRDLIAYLDEQHQGIFIRSVVKLVTDYLRERDNELYVATLKTLVSNPKTRYHLKLLLINGFSRIQDPTLQEKALLEQLILPDRICGRAFSFAVESDKWYAFLLSRGLLRNLVEASFSDPDKLELREWVAAIVAKHVGTNTSLTLDFWQALEAGQTSQLSIGFLLGYVNHWQDSRLIPYFEKYIIYDPAQDVNENSYSFYEILQKIAVYHLTYVIAKVTPILKQLLSLQCHGNGTDMEEEFLEKMFPIYPQQIAAMLEYVLMSCIEIQTEYNSFEAHDCPFFDSLLFTESSFFDHYSLSGKIINLLKDHFAAVCVEGGFDAFFEAHYQSDSIVILSLITEVLTLAPQADKCVLLITTIAWKNGLKGWMDDFQKRLKKMIGLCYPLMNREQQQSTNEVLMSIKQYTEFRVYKNAGKIERYKPWGKQLSFIQELTYEQIVAYTDLKRRYFELYRNHNEKDPSPVVVQEVPLSQENVGREIGFDFMSPQNWRAVFRKLALQQEQGGYSQRMHRRFMDRHDIFSNKVKDNPGAFLEVIEELRKQKSGYNIFLRAAFLGLCEAEYDPAYLMLLYREMISRITINSQLADTLRCFHFLSKYKCVDKWLIGWLVDLALNHHDPDLSKLKDNPYSDSRYGIRPQAMKNLLSAYQQREFSEQIFQTAELVAVSDDHPSKLAVITTFGNLAWIDETRAIRLFLAITAGDDEEVFKKAYLPAKRLMLKDKEAIKPFLDRMVSFENFLANEGIRLIISEYFTGDENFARPYLEKMIKHSAVIQARIITVVEGFFMSHNQQALDLLTDWLPLTGKDVSKSFAGLILRKFKYINFDRLFPFLLKYAASPAVEREFGYYFKYLISQAASHPDQCLRLLKMFNIEQGNYRQFMAENAPMQLLLAVYTTCSKDDARPIEQFEELMDLFDRLVKSEGQRNSLDTIIEKMDA